MTEIISLILIWIHQIATVVWIGGIAFVLFVLIPKAKEVLGQNAGKLIGEASGRFKLFADWSIILLIVTGVGLSIIDKEVVNSDLPESNRVLLLVIKYVFVLLMILIHLFRNQVLAKKIAKEQNSARKIALQKFSLNLVKVVFVFGLIVLLLSAGAAS